MSQYPTLIRSIPVEKYPLVGAWGKQRISSKAGPDGVAQMFVERGLQHELGISRYTVGPSPRGYKFAWELQFYTHPGLRRSIPIPGDGKLLAELVDRIHALTANENLWAQFHAFGLHPDGFGDAKKALRFLRDYGIPWKYAKSHLPKEATQYQP